MYEKSSKKSKSLFWLLILALLALFIYSITLIPLANPFELVIAGLGWAYILLVIMCWLDVLNEIFFTRKKWIINSFCIIAIIGIIGAITLNLTLNITKNPQALPIILIPTIIVILYFIIGLFYINLKKK